MDSKLTSETQIPGAWIERLAGHFAKCRSCGCEPQLKDSSYRRSDFSPGVWLCEMEASCDCGNGIRIQISCLGDPREKSLTLLQSWNGAQNPPALPLEAVQWGRRKV
jgi:hypothetical protein